MPNGPLYARILGIFQGILLNSGDNIFTPASRDIETETLIEKLIGKITPTSFPLVSLSLFAVRDSLTVAASFNAPQVVSSKIEKYGITESKSMILAQLICPAAVQFASTPLHLLALDLYNNQTANTLQHIRFVGREYVKTTVSTS